MPLILIILLTGVAIQINEFEYDRIKNKVQTTVHPGQVLLNFTDVEGGEHLLPFSSVLEVTVHQLSETALDEEDPNVDSQKIAKDGEGSDMSVAKLKEHVGTLTESAEVQVLLDKENAAGEPRKGALEVLEKRLEELSSNQQ